MTIIYDHREDASGVPKELERLGIETQRVTLKIGDYIIQGANSQILIERKEVSDFISSFVGSNRLNNQLFVLSTHYDYYVLILEGYLTGAIIEHENVTKKQVYANEVSAILKRSVDGKQGACSILSVDDYVDTALMLSLIHDRINDPDKMIRLPRLKPLKWTKSDRLVAILSTFPMVGTKRARNILSHPDLNSIEKILAADVKTLMSVDKIGPVTAKGIKSLLVKEYETETNE